MGRKRQHIARLSAAAHPACWADLCAVDAHPEALDRDQETETKEAEVKPADG